MLAHERIELPLDGAAADAMADAGIVDVGDQRAGVRVAGVVAGQEADPLQQGDGGAYFERVQVGAPCYPPRVARDATVVALATRRKSRGSMLEHSWVTITPGEGVVAPHTAGADLRGKPGRRQVTVLTTEGWTQACKELGRQLPWTTRRANVLLSDVTIDAAWATGTHLQIGDALLLITGETAPCARMDEQAAGLRAALGRAWRGGVTCRVVQAGTVRVGDRAWLHTRTPAPAPAPAPATPTPPPTAAATATSAAEPG